MARLSAPARASLAWPTGWLLRSGCCAAPLLLLLGLAGCDNQPPAPSSKALSSAATRAALEKLVDLDVNEAPLGEILDDLSAQANVKFVVIHQSLADAGVSLAEKPDETFRLRGVTLKSALDQLLRPLSCGFHVANGHIHIESLELQQSQCYSEVYLVSDLVEHDSDRLNEKFLADLVTSTVDPQTWYDVGGFAGVTAAPGALIVSHVADGHEQIAELLAELRELYASLEPNSPARPISHRSRYPFKRRLSNTPAAIALREALPRIVSYDFKEVPLGEVCEQIAREQKINIVIDDHALEDAGESRQSLVTGRFLDVTLEMAIRGLLRPLELTYGEGDGFLRITSKESTDCGVEWFAIYAVDDLLEPASGFDERELAEVISAGVEPSSWDEVGGLGIIQPIPRGLVIAQDDDVHEQIGEFLDRLAWVMDHAGDAKDVDEPPSVWDGAMAERLETTVTIERSDQAVRPALNELFELHGLPPINWSDSDDAQYGQIDTLELRLLDEIPSEFKYRNVRLCDILTDKLTERGMEWWILEGRVWTNHFNTYGPVTFGRLYRTTPVPQHAFYAPTDPTIQTLKAHFDFEFWDEVGGASTAIPVPCGLLVDTYPQTHRKVGWFLQALRRLEAPDAPRMVRCSPYQDIDELERTLDEIVTIEADPIGQETIQAFLKRLAAVHGLSDRLLVNLDCILRNATDKTASLLDLPATELPTGEVSLRVVLTHLLSSRELGYWIDESRPQARIVIGSQEQAKWQRHNTRLYRFEPSPQVERNSIERLRDHLIKTVQPDSWGKQGDNAMTVRWPDCVAVTASPEVHVQIAAELDRVLPHFERGEPLPELP